jgi:uncharacterized membrane protein
VRRRAASPYLLAGLLVGAGITHFVRPDFYDALVPPVLPGPTRAWVYGSGALELAVGALVALPRTRRRGALSAAALFVAVFPGNVYMAIEPGDVPRWAAIARLPLQVPLVLWAVQVARRERAGQPTG